MVDLQTQYEFIKEQVDYSVLEIFKKGTFINGPSVKEFQSQLEDYLNVKHVIPCANGTDALQIALMSLDLKPGDEIITSNFTFAATVEVIALLKLKPVLVDIEVDTFNINCDEIIKAITTKTKAIIPVHLFGQVANMDKVMEIAKSNNLFVIEDNAQAIGAVYNSNKKSGTIGHLGTTSFFPSKNLGCFGDGGAIFTENDDLAHTIRGIVNHGMYKRYHHDVVGVNSRLDSVQAAVLKAKLPLLDQYNERRKTLIKGLNEIPGVKVSIPNGAFYCVVELPVKNSENFAKWLLEDFSLNNETIMVAPAAGFYSSLNMGVNQVRIAYVLNQSDLKTCVNILKNGLGEYLKND